MSENNVICEIVPAFSQRAVSFMRDTMARFRDFRLRFHPYRQAQQMILLFLLLGMLVGAAAASFHSSGLSPDVFVKSGRASVFGTWFRVSLFPVLLTASFLLRRKAAIWLLFFLKSAADTCTLVTIACSGREVLSSMLPAFLLETLLPLPFMIMTGARWSRQTERGKTDEWLLAPLLAIAFLSALLETLLTDS